MRVSAGGALVSAVALTLAACAAVPGGATSPTSPARSNGTSGPTASTTSTTTPPPPPSTISLAFAGDVHFEEYLRPYASDPTALEELRSTLGAADLSMVNLETAITERGTPIGKEFHFQAPASALDTVAGAGVDVVTMANNHGVDFGPVGLKDTLAAKKRSAIPIVGIGADADEAYRPAELTVGDVSIAVFGVDQVFDMTLAQYSADADSGGVASSSPVDRVAHGVRRAARTHDLVVVYLHWGWDYAECPDPLSVQTATALEQAGADVIVGSHSHRVDGAGWLDRAYVDYGLGNFVWWRSHEPDSRSGVLTLTVDADAARARHPAKRTATVVTRAKWTPMLIRPDGIPEVATGSDKSRLHDLWKNARQCTTLSG